MDQERQNRFWHKVHRLDEDDCWNWLAAKQTDGYGSFWVSTRKSMLAHRISWTLLVGPIPDGMKVLHRCDNRCCVNPNHLFLGTQADNMQDCSSKGRIQHGERAGRVKLSDDDVARIREMSMFGARRKDVAQVFGISVGYAYCLSKNTYRVRSDTCPSL
jgi:hypothetical protein